MPAGPDPRSDPVANGPEWLADLFFSPPPWVNLSLKIAAAITAVVVAYRLYQWDGDIPLDVQYEMQVIVGHITGILTATLAYVNLAQLPYLFDIALGSLTGYTVVLALQAPAVARRLPLPDDPRERTAAVWFTVGVAVFVLPSVVSTRGLGIQLLKTRALLALIAAAMLAYNVARKEGALPEPAKHS